MGGVIEEIAEKFYVSKETVCRILQNAEKNCRMEEQKLHN